MAFCQQCGQQIPDNANACPYCGTFVAGQGAQQDYQQAAPQQDFQQDYQQAAPQQDFQQGYQQAPQQDFQQGYQQDFQQGYQQNYQQGYAAQPGYAAPVQQPYVTPEMDVQQSRGIAWLSYMGLLFLIPMFVKKYSDYTRFHVKQGVTLCAFELAYSITSWIILAIINAIFPGHYTYSYYYYYVPTYYVHSGVYNVFSVLLGLGSIFFLVMAIIGIVNAASGKRKEIPLFGKIPWFSNLLDKSVFKQEDYQTVLRGGRVGRIGTAKASFQTRGSICFAQKGIERNSHPFIRPFRLLRSRKAHLSHRGEGFYASREEVMKQRSKTLT